MLRRLSNVRKQKGQGIVEYALLLAFILAIAIAMQGSGIDNAIAGTFTRVAQALGFETEQDQWSTMSESELRAVDNSVRLAADKEFLANIGKHFIGMDKSKVTSADVLNTTSTHDIFIGHLVENRDENGNLISTSIDTNGAKGKTGDFFKWATGSTNYDTSRRYLYSDFALDNSQNYYNGQKTGNGIKIWDISYDDNNKVQSVTMCINPNSAVGDGQDLMVTVTKDDLQ